MALPSGLVFVDRRAEDDAGAYFDCTRAGHKAGAKRIRRAFKSKRDREIYITRHDALFHDELLAAKLGVTRAPSLGDVVGDFLQHIRNLVAQKKRDQKTYTYYNGICDKLIAHFGSETPIDTIGRKAMLSFAAGEKRRGSKSEGDRFVKAAKVVKRLQRFADLTVIWEVPTGDISPVHHERESIELEDIRDFMRAMEPHSVERIFTATKFITMLRNEELYAANVGDVNLEEKHLEYFLRNKQTGAKVRHVTYLPDVLIDALRPIVEGRNKTAPLFQIEGRRLAYSSLRKRFQRASERATQKRQAYDPEAKPVMITAIGSFRAEASGLVQEELGATYPVSEHLDHKDEKTTRKHYKPKRKAAVLRRSKEVTELAAAKLELSGQKGT